jgi:hypothetical protein
VAFEMAAAVKVAISRRTLAKLSLDPWTESGRRDRTRFDYNSVARNG